MSKNYAITRVKKYSHVSQVSYLVNHHLRLVDVPNADPARAKKNEILVQKNVMDFLNEVPKGSKKNACRFVDCIFTASHFENKEHERQWQKSTVEFIKKEFGEENLALVVVHNDEKTKHIHVIFKPVNPKTKKLGAGHWFDGRMKMKAYQERYFQAVKDLKFDRGDPNKRAHHTTIKEHYAQINKSANQAQDETTNFKKALVTLHAEVKKISMRDAFRPAKFLARVKPHILDIYAQSKEVFKYQAYNKLAEKEKTDIRLAEENANLRSKLEALTGKENPNWVEVQKYSEVLSAEAEKRTEVLPENGVGVGVAPAIQAAQPDRNTLKKKW